MKSKLHSFWSFVLKHKKVSILIAVIFVGGIYFFTTRNSVAGVTETRYIFAKIQKGSVSSGVTGSGQVSAFDQNDVASEVSGTLDGVYVKAGEEVLKGALIAHIDNVDAIRSVQNAELSLANANASYDKAKKQANNQIDGSTSSDLWRAREDGYNSVANSFVDMPAIFLGMNDLYYLPAHSPYFSDTNIRPVGGSVAIGYKYDSGITFDFAKKKYDTLFKVYKDTPSTADRETVRKLISDTYSLLKELSLALTGTYNTIDYLNAKISDNIPAEMASDKSALSGYISKVSTRMSQLSSALTSLDNAEDSATSADLSLRSASLSVNQAEDNLKNTQEALVKHNLRAPFDGVISKVPLESGDKVSVGTSIATIITKKMKVGISLNEVDAAKINIGDKATLNFDAIDGLVMQGTVSDIDVVGTVSNGVVSYGVKITFDVEDKRIKAGMTTNISISSGSKADVLVVPSTAIHSSGDSSYVFVPITNRGLSGTTDKKTLKEVKVKTGLSGDEYTEIVNGLSEGDVYVSRTVTTVAKTSKSNSILGGLIRTPGSGSTRTQTGTGSSSTIRATNSSSNTGFQQTTGTAVPAMPAQ